MKIAENTHTAETKQNVLSFVALILGAAALALGGVFLRHSELLPTASAVYRVALAIPIFFFLDWLTVRIDKTPAITASYSKKSRRIPVQLVIVGFIFSGNLVLYHWSMTLTKLANANLLANLAPIFVVLGSNLFLKKRFKQGFLFGMLLALSGAFILISNRLDLASDYMLGNLLGLGSAVFYGTYLLAVSLVRSNFRTMTIMAWSSIGTLIILLPLTFFRDESLVPHTQQGVMMLIGLAVVSHVGGQGLIAYSLAKLPAAISSLTLLIQPVIATGLGAFLFHEYMSSAELIGAVVIMVGIINARRHS